MEVNKDNIIWWTILSSKLEGGDVKWGGERRESGLRDKCGISGLNGRRVLRVASFKGRKR